MAEVEDLWALERAGALHGPLPRAGRHAQALDGIGPEELGVDRLLRRVEEQGIAEVILALGATVDGQTTATTSPSACSRLAARSPGSGHGVPVGGELTYLDEGTLDAALRARQRVA